MGDPLIDPLLMYPSMAIEQQGKLCIMPWSAPPDIFYGYPPSQTQGGARGSPTFTIWEEKPGDCGRFCWGRYRAFELTVRVNELGRGREPNLRTKPQGRELLRIHRTSTNVCCNAATDILGGADTKFPGKKLHTVQQHRCKLCPEFDIIDSSGVIVLKGFQPWCMARNPSGRCFPVWGPPNYHAVNVEENKKNKERWWIGNKMVFTRQVDNPQWDSQFVADLQAFQPVCCFGNRRYGTVTNRSLRAGWELAMTFPPPSPSDDAALRASLFGALFAVYYSFFDTYPGFVYYVPHNAGKTVWNGLKVVCKKITCE